MEATGDCGESGSTAPANAACGNTANSAPETVTAEAIRRGVVRVVKELIFKARGLYLLAGR